MPEPTATFDPLATPAMHSATMHAIAAATAHAVAMHAMAMHAAAMNAPMPAPMMHSAPIPWPVLNPGMNAAAIIAAVQAALLHASADPSVQAPATPAAPGISPVMYGASVPPAAHATAGASPHFHRQALEALLAYHRAMSAAIEAELGRSTRDDAAVSPERDGSADTPRRV